MLLSVVLGLWCRLHAASAVTHSLRYFNTGVGGVRGFPEFTAVGLVDGQEFVHYDSDIKRMIPKTEWIERNEGKDYWDRETQIQDETWRIFRDSLGTLQERLGQAGGVHTLQEKYGCEWDEEDGATQGFDQYGYDGRDFIVFNLKTLSWTAPVPQAFQTKLKWNADRAFNEGRKNYLTQECIEWLKKYVEYGRETLNRRERPQVSVFHKDSGPGGTELTCLATGFFPRDILVSWQRDGQEVQEDVDSGELLPNGDGSFQVRKSLRVRAGEEDKYSCRVDHKSLSPGEDIVRTWEPKGGFPIGIIVGVVVGVLVLIAVVGIVIWKKRQTEVREPLGDPAPEVREPLGDPAPEVRVPLGDPAPEVREPLGDPAPGETELYRTASDSSSESSTGSEGSDGSQSPAGTEAEAGLLLSHRLSVALRQAVLLQHPTRCETFQA